MSQLRERTTRMERPLPDEVVLSEQERAGPTGTVPRVLGGLHLLGRGLTREWGQRRPRVGHRRAPFLVICVENRIPGRLVLPGNTISREWGSLCDLCTRS